MAASGEGGDPLCSPRFMPDDVILTCDIDNAGHAPGEHNK